MRNLLGRVDDNFERLRWSSEWYACRTPRDIPFGCWGLRMFVHRWRRSRQVPVRATPMKTSKSHVSVKKQDTTFHKTCNQYSRSSRTDVLLPKILRLIKKHLHVAFHSPSCDPAQNNKYNDNTNQKASSLINFLPARDHPQNFRAMQSNLRDDSKITPTTTPARPKDLHFHPLNPAHKSPPPP